MMRAGDFERDGESGLYVPRAREIARQRGIQRAHPTFMCGPAFFGSSASGSTDPYFSSVSLLLHFNGSNTSTTFTDSSGSPKTISVNGNSQLNTANPKFGSAAGLFDGVGDFITAPDSSAFDFGSGDFTIEFWVRLTSYKVANLVTKRAGSSSFGPFDVYFDGSGKLGILASTNGSSWGLNAISSSAALSLNTYGYIAFVRSGSTFTGYVNSTNVVSGTLSGTLTTNTETLSIAANANGSDSLDGYLDDLRITKGVARTISTPTAAFPDS